MELLALDPTKVRRENQGFQRRTAYRQEDDVERPLLGAEGLGLGADDAQSVACRLKDRRGYCVQWTTVHHQNPESAHRRSNGQQPLR
jgi:hypothetical protein